ncbi:ester cyclase [Jiulongibacter sediminis]|nr:ester cyclase [Jiulongibacter sediminis]
MKTSLFFMFLLAGSLLFNGCSSTTEQADLDANREVVKKYHEVWSNGQVNELDNILAPDFVCHFIAGIEWKGIEGANASISGHRISFPDWNEEIVDMISEGDRVVTRFRSTGTHQGTFNGLDSTGREVAIYETAIYRIADGKIAEQWGFPDEVSLNNQLKAEN